jgi:hypothetical protein
MSGADDRSMLLMAILPIMLICTILVATVLDRRGYLGPSFRLVGVVFPLAAIAASLALASAAILFAHGRRRSPATVSLACTWWARACST